MTWILVTFVCVCLLVGSAVAIFMLVAAFRDVRDVKGQEELKPRRPAPLDEPVSGNSDSNGS